MIRHCVFIRFQAAISREQRDALYADLGALRTQLDGMGAFATSLNVSPEGLDQGFAEGFSIDFADGAARDAYLELPDHKKVGARIVAAAEGGPAGILVFDFDIPGA